MAKYENTNPLSKLHDKEPYFFLRSQDKIAPKAVDSYATLLWMNGDEKGHAECKAFAERMRQWQKENPNKVKMPD